MHIIADYGMGNLASVSRALNQAGIDARISADPKDMRGADSIILPGVGAFGDAAASLTISGMGQAIIREAQRGKYIIGICLGMQLLYDRGYEFGPAQGLGLIRGDIRYIDTKQKVPHMGWNTLNIRQQDPILRYVNEGDYVYFVHSYCAPPEGPEVVAVAQYGISVPAVVRQGNIYGIQFHPEKSSQVGASILKAYREIIES